MEVEGEGEVEGWFFFWDVLSGGAAFYGVEDAAVVGDDTYIVLAVGRDYTDVAPVVGTYFGGGASALIVHVAVRRVDSPAVMSQSQSQSS